MFVLPAGGSGQSKAFLSVHCTLMFIIFQPLNSISYSRHFSQGAAVFARIVRLEKGEFVSWECCPQPGWISVKLCLSEDNQDGYCEGRKVWGMLGMRKMRTSEVFLSLSEEHELNHLF